MSATITIEIDDAGTATVTIDGQEPHECGSVDDCLEYLRDTLQGEEPNEPGQKQEPSEPADMQSMWDDEAQKRAQQRAQMG